MITKETGEKTTLQSFAMLALAIAAAFVVQGNSLEDRMIGALFFLAGAGIILYKYERERSRGVLQ